MRRTSVISIEQKQELKEAFNEFDRDGSGFINTKVRNRHQSKKKTQNKHQGKKKTQRFHHKNHSNKQKTRPNCQYDQQPNCQYDQQRNLAGQCEQCHPHHNHHHHHRNHSDHHKIIIKIIQIIIRSSGTWMGYAGNGAKSNGE